MAEVADELVKQGFWINWSQGSILGATITTNTRTGNVMVALLAVLVSIATGHLWNLLLFAYHQARADGRPRDGLFRQQQILLRSSQSADSLAVDVARLAGLWHSRAPRSIRRCLVFLLIATLFWFASITAGIFTSFAVATDGIEVLVNSPACGDRTDAPAIRAAKINKGANNYYTALSQGVARAAAYALNCYGDSAEPSYCNIYVKPQIPFSTEKVQCPYSPSICLGGNNSAISFDTGLLDSNDDWGINAPPGDRIMFRYKASCTPVDVANRYRYAKIPPNPFSIRPLLPDEHAFYFYYGNSVAQGPNPAEKYTMDISTSFTNTTPNYNLLSTFKYQNPDVYEPWFEPIPELQTNDADISLVFVFSNQVGYAYPNNDPVFSAHKEVHVYYYDLEHKTTIYHADYPAGVVACAEQVQACIPSSDPSGLTCTKLGPHPNYNADLFPQANYKQKESLSILMGQLASIADVMHSVNSPILRLVNYAENGIVQVPIPDDQWQIEAATWFSYVLSEYQEGIAEYAQGVVVNSTIDPKLSVPANTRAGKYLCRSVKMARSGGFTNINVLALVLVISLCGIIVFLDLFVLKFLIYTKWLRKRLSPRVDRWVQDGVWQIQRIAYEGRREGTWDRKDKEVPVTSKFELLSELDNPSTLDATEADEKLTRIDTKSADVTSTLNISSSNSTTSV